MKLQTTLLSLVVSFVLIALACPADDASVAFTPDITIPAQLPQGHPRIYAFESDRESLLKKIYETKWAGDMYSRLEREVKPYVDRHKTDPDWTVGRMQMNWEDGRHFTIFHAKNNAIPLAERSGNAPYPTVRLAAGRVGNGTEQKIEDLVPFGDGNLKFKKRT